ncbi:double-stranded RNA-binding protein 1-like [Silene latifolia]|uniref:double-stranded RNA-binding protein 1-like n=1 Tax=Silene latifolia TaxID=37657 RepID=UPI003D76CC05
MFKSKLQEYCQAKGWLLPEYATTKEGYDHCPQFKASVVVNGATFCTPNFSKSSKEAHNTVAQLAFDYLTTGSSSASPAPLVSATCSTAQQSEPNEALRASPASIASPTNRDDKKLKDMARLYKNQLQIYAQKRNLSLPVYTSEREGPPHASRFKCKVTLEGKTYECQEYFCTMKDAENAAARIALMSVSPVAIEEEDSGFSKNLLQELAQKEYSCLPEYNTISSGPSHAPVFISTVEIKDQSFKGQEAKTKKLAEMYAAKVAYLALKERANQKASEYKHVVVQPKANPNTNENAYGGKVEELPFQRDPSQSPASPAHPPSSPVLIKSKEPWTNTRIPSAQKKVIVFPRTENMQLPPGATIKHQDEKYICVTMDSDTGNAWE